MKRTPTQPIVPRSVGRQHTADAERIRELEKSLQAALVRLERIAVLAYCADVREPEKTAVALGKIHEFATGGKL